MDEETRQAINALGVEFRASVDRLREHIDNRFDKQELKFVTREAHDNLVNRVASLEVDRRKVAWILVAAVLAALLAGVVGSRVITSSDGTTFIDNGNTSKPVPTVTVTR